MVWCFVYIPGIFHSDGYLYNSHCPYSILHTASPLVPRPGATKIPENQFDVSTIAAYPYQGQGTPRPPGPLANGAQWPAHLSTDNNRSPAASIRTSTSPNIYLSCVDIYTYLHYLHISTHIYCNIASSSRLSRPAGAEQLEDSLQYSRTVFRTMIGLEWRIQRF